MQGLGDHRAVGRLGRVFTCRMCAGCRNLQQVCWRFDMCEAEWCVSPGVCFRLVAGDETSLPEEVVRQSACCVGLLWPSRSLEVQV